MAKKFGARKCSKYVVVSIYPSVNKTPVGSSTPPIPYNVQEDLSKSVDVSTDVRFNSKFAFTKKSNTVKVTGDAPGSAKGIKSGTVGAKAEPIEHSPSVKVNGSFVIREDDKFFMQEKNTEGKLITTDSGSGVEVNDEGQIIGDTLPPDLDIVSLLTKMSSSSNINHNLPNSVSPISSNVGGSLGAITGSPVLLKTAQLIYKSQELKLFGKIPLSLERIYLSSSKYKGMFGNDWRFNFEQSFKQIDTNIYRLYLNDGRVFEFLKQDNNNFIDLGSLGVEIEQIRSSNFVLKFFDGKRYKFLNDKLIQIEDNNKNYINIVYENEKIKKIINSEGSWFKFFYNDKDLVEEVVDNLNRTWKYEYDLLNNLIVEYNPIYSKTVYSYKALKEQDEIKSSLLYKIVNHNNQIKLEVEYHEDGRVHSYKEDELRYTYTYNSNTMITKEASNKDIVHYGLNEYAEISSIIHNDGKVSKQSYDKQTKTATFIDKGGNKTYKIYDDRHRVVKKIDQDDKETIYNYEGNNPNPISVVSNSVNIICNYDDKGNLLKVVNGNKIYSYAYDDKANVIEIKDSNDNSIKIDYDENSRPIKYIDAKNNITSISYDITNSKEIITNANKQIIVNSYDKLDNVIQTTQDNHIVKYEYDELNRLVSIIDPLNNITRYEYDSCNRVVKEILPNKNEKLFIYNSDNTLNTYIQEDNSKIEFEYDKAKNLAKIISDDEIVEYSYDSLGNVVKANSNNSNIEYIYDSNANIRHQTQNGMKIVKSYDDLTLELDYMHVIDKGITYIRNNSLLQSIYSVDHVINLEYDKNSVLNKRVYPNSLEESITYDENYNVSSIQTANLTLNYEYNSLNQIVKENDSEFVYDNLNRLVKTPNEEFTYDLVGNELSNSSVYNSKDYNLIYNNEYRLSYDARGNVKEKINNYTKERTLYLFNTKNQLINLRRYNLNGIIIDEFSFTYDAFNRRISKTHNNQTYHYLYDNLNIVAILDNNKKLLATIVHDELIDKPLSITVYSKEYKELDYRVDSASLEKRYLDNLNCMQTFYYHRDHQGSIIALSNKNSIAVEVFTYDNSYGKILNHEKLLETYNPYCYTGRELDSYDLYYYRARYYDPTIKTFISKDPIGFLSGDYNFYRYVANDPVNFTDPSGLVAFVAVPLVEAAAALAAAAVRAAVVRNAPAISRTIGLSRVLGWENVDEKTEEEKILEQIETAAETLTQTGVRVRSEVLTKEEAEEEKRCKDRTGKDTETIMDDYYDKAGYIKVSIDKYHGIDGVYKHSITGEIVVAEAKFGKSQLGRTTDGNRQMSQNWIDKRRENGQIKDETIRKRIKDGDYKPEVFRRKHDCTAWVHDVIQPFPSEAVESPIGRPVIF